MTGADAGSKPLPALLARVFVPFALGYFLSFGLRTVNSVIATDLAADVGLSAQGLGLLTSTFFLSFAAMQLPLGMLLDRFGPRRVEALLLLVAAAGCLLFATGATLAPLTAARALMGAGVAPCMMASFIAFTLWFPAARLPLVNALFLSLGACGALAATGPVEWLLGFAGWRELFIGIAVFAVLLAALLWRVVPEHSTSDESAPARALLRGVAQVLRSRYFWSLAPITALSQGVFLAAQGLWAGPWLRDVAQLDRAAAASVLTFMSLAIVLGFAASGTIADRLARRGVTPLAVAMAGMAGMLATLAVLASGTREAVTLTWAAFGFFGTAGTLCYAALSQHFPRALAGRANTALNLLVFVMAFLLQWGIGLVLGQFNVPEGAHYAPRGYQLAFALITAAQLLALLWFLWFRPRERAG